MMKERTAELRKLLNTEAAPVKAVHWMDVHTLPKEITALLSAIDTQTSLTPKRVLATQNALNALRAEVTFIWDKAAKLASEAKTQHRTHPTLETVSDLADDLIAVVNETQASIPKVEALLARIQGTVRRMQAGWES